MPVSEARDDEVRVAVVVRIGHGDRPGLAVGRAVGDGGVAPAVGVGVEHDLVDGAVAVVVGERELVVAVAVLVGRGRLDVAVTVGVGGRRPVVAVVVAVERGHGRRTGREGDQPAVRAPGGAVVGGVRAVGRAGLAHGALFAEVAMLSAL